MTEPMNHDPRQRLEICVLPATELRDTMRQEIQLAIAPLVDELRSNTRKAPGEFLTVDEAAKLVHVAPKTIRKWIHDRRLEGRWLGRLLRIAREDLEAFTRRPAAEADESIEEIADRILAGLKPKPKRTLTAATALIGRGEIKLTPWYAPSRATGGHCTMCGEWKNNVVLNRKLDADVCHIRFFRPRRVCVSCGTNDLTN